MCIINISIIIPTLNRSSLLNSTLESILQQTYRQDDFEIIVVDNGSKDNTKEIVESYNEQFKNIRYLYDAVPGLHVGRHLGLQNAKGNILVYLDDDVKMLPGHLEAVEESFKDEQLGLLGGNNLPEYEIAPPDWVNQLWKKNDYGMFFPEYSLIDFGNKTKQIPPNFVYGCNYSIRKDILMKIKGFHPDCFPNQLIKYTGDGETFVAQQVKKMGYKILFNPLSSVYHFVSKERLTLKYLQQRWYYNGIGISYSYIRRKKNVSCKKALLILLTYIRYMGKGCKIAAMKQKCILNAFLFHQKEFYKNKHFFRNWVLREHYMGNNGVI